MNINEYALEQVILGRLSITLKENTEQLSEWLVINQNNCIKLIEQSYYLHVDTYYLELEGKVQECSPASFISAVKDKEQKQHVEERILSNVGSIKELKRMGKLEAVTNAIIQEIMNYIINHKRVNAVVKRVCMFAKEIHTKHEKDNLVIVYPFELLPTGNIDNKVIEDYKEHYTELDEFIKWLVSARFASDRKYAFLYFLAKSNWGKGLLFNGILSNRLGLVTEIKEGDLIKINKSEAVGLSPDDMLHSWILLINELGFLPDEVKELESTINLRPLYKAKTKANVYAKIFCNASDMGLKAFNGGNGVIDEHKNRFSFIEHKKLITDRPLFNKDKKSYADSLANYIADEINKQVEDYRKLGESEATRTADQRLTAFKNRHCITKKYSSEDWQFLADEFKEWLFASNMIHGRQENGLYIITQPAKKYELFIEDSYPREDKKYYMSKRTEIINRASADDKGVKVIYHKDKSYKGFLIKKEANEAESKVINANF